ncbi:cytochrome c oxidase subunit 3 (plasmid) [Rhizobium sp. CB3090]|uniref:cytochrome c oxidase subunit 3 n=1 Tax=Rhizobium sp. CB3090 TaxID=3039156 RepID=UPI0024B05016|nr:cytochrome c oxidase subunit 3 [Rhizobium sp. CB3090]WFU11279.1 cytochrome c oxidase subunit 3 [Rhizobium sp. CB3090]
MPETLPVTEPYRDARQQHEAAMMGMYIFLGSEIMLFGGIFSVAAALRLAHSPEIIQASHALHFGIGGMNTAVLLTSSLFVALGVEAGRGGKANAAAGWVTAAAVLGLCFLAVKAYEYRLEFSEGLLPVPGVQSRYVTGVQHLFMDLYLVATALHALHLTIGVVLLATLAVQTARGAIPVPERAIVLITAGLYWHLVDVVWVFLYPVFYLAR